MIHLKGRGDLPEPSLAVYRGIQTKKFRLTQVFLRFFVLVGLLGLFFWKLPGVAQLLLDPLGASTPGSALPTAKSGADLAFWIACVPVSLLLLAWALAATQQSFTFQGRRIALRKQSWALFREFQTQIESSLDPDELPLGFRMVDPPELATSLLLRLGLFWLSLLLCLLAVVIPLSLRIHWPAEGQAIWYRLMLCLSGLGVVTLLYVRTPPVLRLFIQSAIPAMHFGHALMMGTSVLNPLGIPCFLLDCVLGVLSGMVAYRLGQSERGGALLLFTDQGLLAFDPAGRETRLLWSLKPLQAMHWHETPSGAQIRFLGSDGNVRSVAVEAPESAQELFEELQERGLSLQGGPETSQRGILHSLTEPGWLGWGLLLFLLALVSYHGAQLATRQTLLAGRLLPHLSTWAAGNPTSLLQGSKECLEESPHFLPAQVFHAIALTDLGHFAEANTALKKLPANDSLHGFAKRVIPPRRERVARFFALEAEVSDPSKLAEKRAFYLVTQVGGPAAAQVALSLMEQSGTTSRSQQFVQGLALLQAPATNQHPNPLQEAQLLGQNLSPGLEGTFLQAWVALNQGQDLAALQRIGREGKLITLAAPLGEELMRVLVIRSIGAEQRGLLPEGHTAQLVQNILSELPPKHRFRLELELFRVASLKPKQAKERLAQVAKAFPSAFEEHTNDGFPLGRVLAEEALGNPAWASYAASRLIGPQVARHGNPDRVPELRALEPLARRYVAGLSLLGLNRTQEGNQWVQSASDHPDFPWPVWAKQRARLQKSALPKPKKASE